MLYISVREVRGVLRGVFVEDVIELFDYEIDLLKMVHIDGLTIEEIALRIGVSKATTWRIIENARIKIIKALYENKIETCFI